MNTRIFTIGTVLAAVLLTGTMPASAEGSATDRPAWSAEQAQTERFSKTVPLGKAGRFELTNISGDITVTGVAGDQVIIEAVKRSRSADDLKQVTIEVMASQGRVEVQTRYPERSRNLNVSVDFTIKVPKDAEVRLSTVSGDIRARDVNGLFRGETISGDVDLNAIANLEAAKSASGDITIDACSSAGDMSVSTMSGDVDVRSSKARSMDLNSVSGDVTVTGSSDRLAATSVSGSLRYSGPLARGGRYELQTHSGDVTVETGEQVGFEVTASSFSGDVESAVALTVTFGGDRQARGRRRNQEIRGTFGDGSAKLVLTSFSGDVRIVRK